MKASKFSDAQKAFVRKQGEQNADDPLVAAPGLSHRPPPIDGFRSTA